MHRRSTRARATPADLRVHRRGPRARRVHRRPRRERSRRARHHPRPRIVRAHRRRAVHAHRRHPAGRRRRRRGRGRRDVRRTGTRRHGIRPSRRRGRGRGIRHRTGHRRRREPTGRPRGTRSRAGADGVRIGADTAAGLFWGTQSLRQLLPAEIGRSDAATRPHGAWTVPAASVADRPALRLPRRDARRRAPLLLRRRRAGASSTRSRCSSSTCCTCTSPTTRAGASRSTRGPSSPASAPSTSVGGDGGGFYTKADYRRIVAYAAERFITIVPEIDLPGHTNAALSAYPELNCDGVAPAPYEGIEVGFSSLCAAPDAPTRPTGSSTTSRARSPS